MPMQIRAYALQKTMNDTLLKFALGSTHWQLRAGARDTLLRRNDLSAEQLLLDTIAEGEVFEAQEAIKTLVRNPQAFAKIEKANLRKEVQMEYAEAMHAEIQHAWLLHGGNPLLGRKIVFENTRSECLRCHTIEGRGGIAGPVLDGVGIRLQNEQLLDALLFPNTDVADGFGDYSAMPPMVGLLNSREIRDVVAYLKTLK